MQCNRFRRPEQHKIRYHRISQQASPRPRLSMWTLFWAGSGLYFFREAHIATLHIEQTPSNVEKINDEGESAESEIKDRPELDYSPAVDSNPELVVVAREHVQLEESDESTPAAVQTKLTESRAHVAECRRLAVAGGSVSDNQMEKAEDLLRPPGKHAM